MLLNTYALALSSETITMMWQTPLLGMGMIFAVLGILWGVLAIFKLVFARPKKEAKVEAPKSEPVIVEAPAPVAEEAAVEEAPVAEEAIVEEAVVEETPVAEEVAEEATEEAAEEVAAEEVVAEDAVENDDQNV